MEYQEARNNVPAKIATDSVGAAITARRRGVLNLNEAEMAVLSTESLFYPTNDQTKLGTTWCIPPL
jgi:hypothetical protein